MNVDTITIDPELAKQSLSQYASARRSERDEFARSELAAVEQAMAKCADGLRMIDLHAAIQDAPRNDKGLPMLAIARADRRQVRCELWRNECTFSANAALSSTWGTPSQTLIVRIPSGAERPWSNSLVSGYSLVPMIPANVANKCGLHSQGTRTKRFVFWEVEQWSDRMIGATPDRDPYLLEHLFGALYAVHAEWDLTDLERAVMQGRANIRR